MQRDPSFHTFDSIGAQNLNRPGAVRDAEDPDDGALVAGRRDLRSRRRKLDGCQLAGVSRNH